jgi:hypothetical protein
MEGGDFQVARNPDEASGLPLLLRIPIEGGLVLKAREAWPSSSRVYCHPAEEGWPEGVEVIEEVPVRHCRRRGSAIDLVLDRPRNNRAQFVFTRLCRRPAIYWQTAKVAKRARPGVRARKASGLAGWTIAIDTRERYPYPDVPIVFCQTRKLAEEWAYRFLAAAPAGFGQ